MNTILAPKTLINKEFHASAISPEIAALNFVEIPENFDLDNSEAAELLLYNLDKGDRRNDGRLIDKYNHIAKNLGSGGWWCGTLNPDGTESRWGCFKPNNPRTGKDGKILKYEHPPKTNTQPFYLKVDRRHWEKIAVNAGLEPPDLEGLPDESIPHEFWSWVISKPELPIIITEGAKKTASLLSAGFCAVGLSGIWNGIRNPINEATDEKTGEHYLVPELAAIAQKGREFTFCFDNDEKPKTKAAVNKAIAKTAELLTKQTGCKSYGVMKWADPDLKGIDDVHAAKGEPELWRIYDERTKKKIVISKSEEQRAKEKLAIAAAILEANGDRLENYLPKVEARTSTPLQPVVTYLDAEDPDAPLLPDDDEEEEEKPTLTYQEIALQAIYSDGHYVAFDGELYKFNGKFYEKRLPQSEKRRIIKWASSYVVRDRKTGKKTFAHMNPRSIAAIWAWVLDRFGEDPQKINPRGLNLANGVLRITWEGRKPRWKLHPHTPKDIYMYCSEVNYDPNADPKECDRLLECLDPAPRIALLRQLSAAFDLETVRKMHSRGVKAAIAKGTGANGKDSIRAAISKIFCNQMTSLGLGEFQAYDNGRKFGLAALENSLINWSSENNLGTPLDRIEALNICVTGEEGGIWIERKGKDGYAFTPRAIHIFNTNQLPKLKSGMDSLLSRFVVYDFNKTFKQHPNPMRGELQADARFHDDPQFLINEVCPALLNRLLAELENLTTEGIDYDALQSGLDDIQEESTHLWSFVQDHGLEVDPDGKVAISDLWEDLRKWYIETGTLEIEEFENGKTRNIWHEQANQYDRNITGANQVYKRFKLLFPKIKRLRETADQENRGRFYILGLSFRNSASLLRNPDKSIDSASLPASFCFTDSNSSSLSFSNESKNEAKNEGGNEAETLALQGSEATKQKVSQSPSNSTQPKNLTQNANGDRLEIPFNVGDRVKVRQGQMIYPKAGIIWVWGTELEVIGKLGTKNHQIQVVDPTDRTYALWVEVSEVEAI